MLLLDEEANRLSSDDDNDGGNDDDLADWDQKYIVRRDCDTDRSAMLLPAVPLHLSPIVPAAPPNCNWLPHTPHLHIPPLPPLAYMRTAVKKIAKKLGITAQELLDFNGSMDMRKSPMLKVGTELWVSGAAMAHLQAAEATGIAGAGAASLHAAPAPAVPPAPELHGAGPAPVAAAPPPVPAAPAPLPIAAADPQ